MFFMKLQSLTASTGVKKGVSAKLIFAHRAHFGPLNHQNHGRQPPQPQNTADTAQQRNRLPNANEWGYMHSVTSTKQIGTQSFLP